MANIDNLQIKISADASTAAKSLDNLCTKLNNLSTAVHGVGTNELNGLATALGNFSNSARTLGNIKTADFTRLIKNLNSINSINSSGLNSLASAMNNIGSSLGNMSSISSSSTQIAELARGISKLGGANVSKAITQMPSLATAINSLMRSLSKAPQVSSNLIAMTYALGNLASQGSKVGQATRSITNNMDKLSVSAKTTKKSMTSLAAAFGKFYANCFLIIRGVKGLWSAIKSSMDYLEVANYFNAAMDQVTSKSVSGWQEAGYESAEAYANSFTSVMQGVQSKMTGYVTNLDGSISNTGGKSLGINPSTLTNYEATFAQMASSMGATSDQAVKLSQALTEIGADLASVKNMDFEEVWGNMASGLVGMSRTLDKYGVNIRNVNLQQKLTNLGIQANIQSLNQSDKALLRTIILLESTTYAWGDLADTIESPANQLRLLQANFKNFTRTLGNLFLPVVQVVIKYVNALTISLTGLLERFAALIGVDLSGMGGIGSASDDASDLMDSIYGADDALQDATEDAKKLKNTVNGIDELNINNPNDSSSSSSGLSAAGSGLLDDAFNTALENYQSVWDEAFANMENRVQEMADKITGAFQKAIDFIKKGEFKELGSWIGGKASEWMNAFISNFDPQKVANVVNGIALTTLSALNTFFENTNWDEFGTKIGEFLKGIDFVDILSEVGKLIWNAINAAITTWESCFDAAPIETTIVTAIGILSFTPLGSILKAKVGNAILVAFKNLSGDIMAGITLAFEAVKSGEFASLSSALKAIFSPMAVTIAGIVSVIGGAVLAVKEFVDMWTGGWSLIKTILEALGIALGVIGAILLGAPAVIAAVVGGAILLVSQFAIVIHDNWDSIVKWTKELWDKVKAIISPITNWVNTNIIVPVRDFFVGLGTRIGQVFEGCWIVVQAIWKLVAGWFNNTVITPVKAHFTALTTIMGQLFSAVWDDIKEKWKVVSGWFDEHVATPIGKVFEALGNTVGNIFKGIVNGIADKIEKLVNGIVDSINSILGKFNKFVSVAANFVGADWSGVDEIPRVSIPRYSTGGTPEDGLFYANHTELVGSFSNGKTAVANNDMIVDGIEGGVERAVVRSLQPYLERLVSTNETIASKDMSVDIDGRELVSAMNRRSARNGFSFA